MSRPARATPEEESFALAKESRSASSKAEELARPSNDDPIGWDRMDGRAHVTARRLPLRERLAALLQLCRRRVVAVVTHLPYEEGVW